MLNFRIMAPWSVSGKGAGLAARALVAPVRTGSITIHSVGEMRGEPSSGVEAGLDRGVARVEHGLRGVWGFCVKRGESVGV